MKDLDTDKPQLHYANEVVRQSLRLIRAVENNWPTSKIINKLETAIDDYGLPLK